MAPEKVAQAAARWPRLEICELAVPECAKGIGAVIGSPSSADLIAGVRVAPLALYPDDRGYFLEVQRFGQGWPPSFRPPPARFRRP